MLQQQTFTDWEWILVDDGSKDNTEELVDEILDERIRFYSYHPNRGRGFARSVALDKANGNWIVVWDVDDLYFPDRLAQIEQARLEGYDFCCSYAALVNNQLEYRDTRGFYLDETGTVKIFVHHTLGCNLSLAKKIGYDKNLRAGEDATIVLTLAMKYKGLWIEEALTAYQEDREVNVKKSIISNRAQLSQTKRLYKAGLLELEPSKYLSTLLKWNTKMAVLNLFRLCPPLYLKTVGRRAQGKKSSDWCLSEDRMKFIANLQERHEVQDWPTFNGEKELLEKLELTKDS